MRRNTTPHLKHTYSELPSPTSLAIHHLGPDLSLKHLPAFFYFSLSGKESLTLDPYNQPAAFLNGKPIRTFSFTLPFHGPEFDNQKGVLRWVEELKENPRMLHDFFDLCHKNIQYLIDKEWIQKDHLSVGGLSRGAFIATHLAAENPHIDKILGFAPLTYLENIESLNLEFLIPKLIGKSLRFYIGNHDTRVGTDSCFRFIKSLADYSFTNGIRSPPVELIISPSVGHKGHGTLPPIFQAGADWILAGADPLLDV